MFFQVRRLEVLLVTVQEDCDSRLRSLSEELRSEREARRRAETELDEMKRGQRW